MRIILLSPGGYKSASTQNSKVSVNADHLGLFPALPLSRNVFLQKVLVFFIWDLICRTVMALKATLERKHPCKCHAGCLNLVFDGCTAFVTGL